MPGCKSGVKLLVEGPDKSSRKTGEPFRSQNSAFFALALYCKSTMQEAMAGCRP